MNDMSTTHITLVHIKQWLHGHLEGHDNSGNSLLNTIMMVLVMTSVVTIVLDADPTIGETNKRFLGYLDDLFIDIFLCEYMLRFWVCSDFSQDFSNARKRYTRRRYKPPSFAVFFYALRMASISKLRWMRQPSAIIDLLAILPVFRIFRLFRVLRVLRLLKLFRYSRRLSFFSGLFRKHAYELIALASVAAVIWGMVAVAFFVVERESNPNLHSVGEAVYWSIITISTVGYGDIVPVTGVGRAIAVIGTLFGMWVIVFMTSIVVSALTDRIGHLTDLRVEGQVERCRDHVIICGLNVMGRAVCRVLENEGKRFVGVDINPETVDMARRNHWIAVQGDVGEEAIWHSLGLNRAHSVISTIVTEATNVHLVLAVREQRPDCLIVTCCSGTESDSESAKRLRRVGADRLVMPFGVGGVHMAHAALRPHVIQFYDMALKRDIWHSHVELAMEEITIPPRSLVAGRTIRDIYAKKNVAHVIVIGHVPENGTLHFKPHAASALHAGDIIVCLGHMDDLARFRAVIEQRVGLRSKQGSNTLIGKHLQ